MKKNITYLLLGGLICLLLNPFTYGQDGFPFKLPKEKPDRGLSLAMERNYTAYPAPRPEDNELYTLFKYTELEGFDYKGFISAVEKRMQRPGVVADAGTIEIQGNGKGAVRAPE